MISSDFLQITILNTDWEWHDIQDRSKFNAKNAHFTPTVNPAAISIASVPYRNAPDSAYTGFNTTTAAATGKFTGGVLGADGCIYFIPFDGTDGYFLRLDPTDDSLCILTGKLGEEDQLFWGGVLGPNGIIYCIPYNYDFVTRIDTKATTNELSNISTELTTASKLTDTTTMKWCGGVLAPNGIIYCAPYNAGYILKIDTRDDSLSVMKDGDSIIDVDLSSSDNYSGSGTYCYQGAVLGPNGKVYFIPHNAKYIAEVDPVTDTLKMYTDIPIDASNAGIATYKYSGGVLGPDGYIYMVPCRANKVLRFDATKDTISGVEVVTTNFKTTNTTYYKYCGGVLGPDGSIFFIPLDSSAASNYSHKPYILSTQEDGLNQEIGTQTLYAYKWRGGVLAPNGCIYCAPFGRNEILKISPYSLNVNFGLSTLLSPYLNKF